LARRSVFASVVDALKTAKHGAGERVFFIDCHYDDKAPARAKPTTGAVSAAELAKLAQRLAAMDRRAAGVKTISVLVMRRLGLTRWTTM